MTAEEFREASKKLGLTMAEAAKRCKVPYRTWQDWELGNSPVPAHAFCFLYYLRNSTPDG